MKKRELMKKNGVICLMLAVILALSACGGKGSESSSPPATGSQSSANTNGVGQTEGSKAEEDPYFGKYDQPLEVTTVRRQDDTFKFDSGESLDNNVWTGPWNKS